MPTETELSSPAALPTVTPRLLQAALVGLLCVAVPACGSDDDESAPHVTSSKHVENLDAAGFQALCDARGGTVEIMVHCGGLASARGFSYDITTQELAEHTCKGANTCTGWNCVTD